MPSPERTGASKYFIMTCKSAYTNYAYTEYLRVALLSENALEGGLQ